MSVHSRETVASRGYSVPAKPVTMLSPSAHKVTLLEPSEAVHLLAEPISCNIHERSDELSHAHVHADVCAMLRTLTWMIVDSRYRGEP